MQTKKIKIAMICTGVLFLLGHLFVFLGLAYGASIASVLSRPWGASSWSTSGELMTACTYVPVIMGGCFIFLSLVATFFFFRMYLDQYLFSINSKQKDM